MKDSHEGNKCTQCDYASFRADVLRTHLKIHSGQKSNKCQQCDFVRTNFMKRKYLFDVKCHPLYLQATAWEYSLKRHMEEAHGDGSHMVECPTCGKRITG